MLRPRPVSCLRCSPTGPTLDLPALLDPAGAAGLRVPVLTVDDLQVHVDPGDEHLTVDADLVEGGRGQGVGHRHHPHDLIGHRAAVRQRHPDTQPARDVDHLRGAEGRGQTDRGTFIHSLIAFILSQRGKRPSSAF